MKAKNEVGEPDSKLKSGDKLEPEGKLKTESEIKTKREHKAKSKLGTESKFKKESKPKTKGEHKPEGTLKQLLHIYKTTKLPWLQLILVVATGILMQALGVWLIPYSSKIDTGQMTGGTFIIAYIGMSALYNIMESAQELCGQVGKERMSRNVRRRMWRKMLHLPTRYYDKEEPQKLVSRVTNDTNYAYSALSGVLQTLTIIYGTAAALYEVVQIYAGLTWIMVAMIPAVFLGAIAVGKIQYVMNRIQNDAYSHMTNYYAERLPHITYIKTNQMEREEYDKGCRVSQQKYRTDIKYYVMYVLQSPFQSLANYIGMIFVLWTASAMVRAGQMEMSQLISLNAYFSLVMENAVLFLGVWQAIKTSHGGCAKITEIDTAEEENISGGVVPENRADIVFADVSFAYGEGHDVLKNVSFTIPKGKYTAIVGENGCGKSTIVKLLERFESPNAGEILLGTDDLQALDLKEWRNQLGLVFQGNQNVQGSVRENVTYGINREYSEEELLQTVRDAEAYDFIQEKEEKFDTDVGLYDSEFSGGQLQRLSIARMLMKNPEYLLMDEATSGIDAETEGKIWTRVQERMSDRTRIVITHNMQLALQADHVVVIADGTVEAEGAPEEVLGTSETFARFCGEYA